MNQDTKNLNKFISIFKSLMEMERAYIELEEFGASYSFSDYFNACLDLNDDLEKIVNINNLTSDKANKYKELNLGIYNRLKYDYPKIYSIGGNIEDIFHQAYEKAEESILNQLIPYKDKPKPFFACGFSFFELYTQKYSLLEIMLDDKLFNIENFIYANGRITMNILELNEKYGLTGQEYEIYEKAYAACGKLLQERLGLKISLNCYISS